MTNFAVPERRTAKADSAQLPSGKPRAAQPLPENPRASKAGVVKPGASKRGASKVPKYAAVAARLRDRMLAGELKVGDRLPSFTELRRQYGATPTTVERVYSLLEQEGLAERRQGSGTFVKKPQRHLTGNIGFIGGSVIAVRNESFRQPYYSLIMGGVQQAIENSHNHLLYMGTSKSLKVRACEKVDGVLLCGMEDISSLVPHFPPGLTSVALLNSIPGITSIVADDYGGATLAARHLIEKGHRRIACLMDKHSALAQRRYAGYNSALMEANIEAQPGWARLTPSVHPGNIVGQAYVDWGREQMSAWLQEGWLETGCTAIFAQNDLAAIGVMQALQAAGIRVPQQVSVIGFDGTSVCDLTVPRLTAVQVPLAQIGARGVEVLEQQIQSGKSEAQTIVLPMILREGESVGPPPA